MSNESTSLRYYKISSFAARTTSHNSGFPREPQCIELTNPSEAQAASGLRRFPEFIAKTDLP